VKNLRTLTVVLTLLLLATFLVSGCQTILVPKNGETEAGKMETRQYDFSEFKRVDISSAFSYEIMQSDTYRISITANNNLFDDIKVAQEGQTLIIGMEFPAVPWAIKINTNPSPKAVIAMPQLYGLDSSGATRGTVAGFSSSEELDVTASGASSVELVEISMGDIILNVSGSSEVTGGIEAKNMELKVSGASTVQLKGSAGDIAADGSGSSKLKLADLKVENANVILSGASNGTINLDGNLDVKLSGSSKLVYIGEPALGVMDITGASTLKKK